MRAARFFEPGRPMEIAEVPDPSPGRGELVIRVRGCGICGSDLHVTELPGAVPSGSVMGHEFAGDVVAVGNGAVGPDGPWREGDRICALPGIGCGRCARCLTGDVMGCEALRATGFGEIGGGYAEYAVVGARESFRLPERVASADGALVEPLAVGLHAVDAASSVAGRDLLVLGAGPVGLAVSIWARLLGAREVVVSDPVEPRRALALTVGATATIDPATENVGEAFARVAGAGPGVVFECVGRPGMLGAAAEVAVRGGEIVSAGMCMQPETLSPLVCGVKELAVRFVSYYRNRDFALTVDMLAAERIDPLPLITDRVPLDGLPAAFEALRQPTAQCKVLVEP